jgi:outer membrane receptor protein involved in Fe transport
MRRIDRRFTNTSEQLIQDANSDAWSAAGWAHYRWTPSTRFSITNGARFEHWQLFDQSRVSPWLLSEFEARPGLHLRLGAGIQYQSASLDNAQFVLPGDELKPQRAATIELGIEQRFGDALRLNLSGYHRDEKDDLRAVNTDIRLVGGRLVLPTNPHWANRLSGNSNGVEIVLERRAANGLNGWLSYALSDSQLTDQQSGETFAADFDQRHTVNTYVAYRWGGRTSLSARMRYGSNFPIAGYIGEDANGFVISEQRNGLRMPDYARLDLRADRAFTYRKSRLTLFLEVVNATNRDNYRPNSPGINISTRRVFDPFETTFPLLPVAGVLIEF